MSTLSREHRRMLENTVAQARAIAAEGARKVLRDQYAIHHHEPWPHMTAEHRKLRNQLRAHGRQLGDKRDTKRETQEIEHLVQACAYEHWHRMLFARFLAENGLLLDAENGVAMTLDDIRELAREQNRDWMDVAAALAQRMLLAVFRSDDPVLNVQLPPETRQQLEEKLASLPSEVFQADDSLGWVYQFWQRDAKETVDAELVSGAKADADRIPPKTQFFTDDYMVLFLLENTLGAWWTAKRSAEGKDPGLPGYQWTYLRLNEGGSPIAGSFDSWPRIAREIRLLDPCMGSGHFLVFALPLLARMRMEEEGLLLKDALAAVLRENLYGLEIDARCSQIAAFNLALAAWRVAGEHFEVPKLSLACSGLGINTIESDWMKLAGGEYVAEQWMRRLYSLFRDAPTLGSLIDPTRFLEKGQEVGFERVLPLIEEALQREKSEDTLELAIAAEGVLAAFRILSSQFTLVATNVPYLGHGKQDTILAQYCEEFHSDAKADLATCFVDRCRRFAREGCSVALVTPQNWLFLTSYKKLRSRLLKSDYWDFVARLGEHAFDSPAAAGAFAALLGLTRRKPLAEHTFVAWKLEFVDTPEGKAEALKLRPPTVVSQQAQYKNPDSVVALEEIDSSNLLGHYATCYQGISPGDSERLVACFWEITSFERWRPFQAPPVEAGLYRGREYVIDWPVLEGGFDSAAIRGQEAWNLQGVAIGQMRGLPATLYSGDLFSNSTPVIIPRERTSLAAIWCFCAGEDFAKELRKQNPKLSVDNGYVSKIPFDLGHWSQIAAERYPHGLPGANSTDPTQWLFNGQPKGSDHPLQVAVARLLGYLWPRQTGSNFPGCPAVTLDGLETHATSDGIVPLNAIAGEASAADRLRALLMQAYESEWSAAKLQELLGDWDSLEDWLRDGFFEEHCRIFDQRPVVWHMWDGRKDGFHALVNYHALAAPEGEGRKTLEKLIYTYLGRWIERQADEVRSGKEGADARLTAATHLKAESEKILRGEKPYDIFVRWKPLHEQPIGWEPDINDGVRLNIRPWSTAKVHQPSRRDGCILRVTPRIPYGKDRGKEPHQPKEDFPWFWTWDGHSDDFMGDGKFDGVRWNDLHYSLAKKKEAREKHKSEVGASLARKA
jgi:hypothetical protein